MRARDNIHMRSRLERRHETLFSFPYTHAVSVAMVSSALNLLVQMGPSPFDSKLIGTMAVVAIISAGIILLGLQWRGSVFTSRGIEMLGHALAFAVWLLDAYVIWFLVGFSAYGLPLVTPLVFAGAACIRAVMLWRENKEALAEVIAMIRAAEALGRSGGREHGGHHH